MSAGCGRGVVPLLPLVWFVPSERVVSFLFLTALEKSVVDTDGLGHVVFEAGVPVKLDGFVLNVVSESFIEYVNKYVFIASIYYASFNYYVSELYCIFRSRSILLFHGYQSLGCSLLLVRVSEVAA